MNSLRKFYILIAEDDADDRFLLKTAFEESGYKNTLKFVENGVELIKHLKEVTQRKNNDEYPGFILLDLNIGKENGLSAIRPAKKLAPTVKVVMLTTFNNTYAEAEAFRSGASGFLLKIYEVGEIIELIQKSFYHPDDRRLFPNLTHGSLPHAANPKTTQVPDTDERPGFFGALRQLWRPHRRQAAD